MSFKVKNNNYKWHMLHCNQYNNYYYQVATCSDVATIATHCQIRCVIICIHINIFPIKLLTDIQPGCPEADTFNYHKFTFELPTEFTNL